MTNQNNTTTTNESQAEPTIFEVLTFSGLSPEVFRALDDVRKAEWRRAYLSKKAAEVAQ